MSINVKTHPVAGRIGAEVTGIDLGKNLSDAVINAIRQALMQYKVLFFRQQHLDAEGEIAANS